MLLFPVTSYAKQWTLQDCINYALQHNISLQKTRLQRLTAAEDVKESQAALLPSLSGMVSQNVSLILRKPYSVTTLVVWVM